MTSPTSAGWSGKIPEPDLNHSMFDLVKGLHRRETTQLPEEVLFQIILELKGQFNKRYTRGFSFLITRAFPISPRSPRASQSFVLVPRRLSLDVPLPFDCSRCRNHHDQWTMGGFVNGAGWHGTGSKSDTEVLNPVSATLEDVAMSHCSARAGPEGILQFPTIVFGQGAIFRPSAHVRRPRAAFATCPDPRQ